jgi:hypothetical protein
VHNRFNHLPLPTDLRNSIPIQLPASGQRPYQLCWHDVPEAEGLALPHSVSFPRDGQPSGWPSRVGDKLSACLSAQLAQQQAEFRLNRYCFPEHDSSAQEMWVDASHSVE